VRIAESGTAVPIDVYQRLINSNFNLQVHRTMLLDDNMPRMATDARGASAFVAFQQDLLRLQAELDRSAPASWRIEPRRLKANINA
jgi:arachidonate 15-lipoxygenase